MKRVFWFVTVSFVFSISTIVAQQNLSLYYQSWLPQTNELNPAIGGDCKFYLGGLVLPIAGQLLPNLHYNYSNNFFAYKDIIYLKDGVPTIDNSSIENFLDGTKKVNYLTFENYLPFLYGGFRVGEKFYVSLGITDKFDTKFSFPRDLFYLLWKGNGNDLGKVFDFTGLGFDFTYYTEFKFGLSWKLDKNFTVGISPKILFGKLNMTTSKTTITWQTIETDFSHVFHVDWELNTSQPLYIIREMYYDYNNDSLVYEDSTRDVSVSKFILNNKNLGFGVDLGAIYKMNDKITFYGSVIDLGYIKWKDNVQTLTINGDFVFDGYDVTPLLEDNDSLNEANADNYRDSVIRIFEPELQRNAYSTFLTPKFYLGGVYQWKEFIGFGALMRFEFYKYVLHPSFTLSANTRLTKWFGATISYSIMNSTYTNIGLALIFKVGPVQGFLASDNVVGFIWPQSTRNINLRMGLNLKFGCKKYEGTTLI